MSYFGNASFEIVESESEFNFTHTLAERVKTIRSRRNKVLDIKYSVAVRHPSVRVYTALIIYRRVNE